MSKTAWRRARNQALAKQQWENLATAGLGVVIEEAGQTDDGQKLYKVLPNAIDNLCALALSEGYSPQKVEQMRRELKASEWRARRNKK